MLKFSPANAKIEALKNVEAIKPYLQKRKVFSLDLLSGFSCPYANNCLSRAIVTDTGRHIKDGPNTQFRCFSATQELIFANVYKLRKHNFDLLKSTPYKYELIKASLPAKMGVCRIHVGGDFFNEDYMLAWAKIAHDNPSILFYAYTKSLNFWIKNREFFSELDNFVLTASYGGRLDHLISEHGLRSAKVILSEDQANGLTIDHDDSAAADPARRNDDFALLIHGVQPAGTEANKALQVLKKNKVKHSYTRAKV